MLDMFLERLNAFWLSLRITWRLIQDSRVPIWTKAIPILTVLYILSPLDVIPDFLLIIGQIDDVFLLTAGLQLFERLAPFEIVEEHRQGLLAETHQQRF
jgi:uncharacterized membrane protein YkvA (DUF1232 family)